MNFYGYIKNTDIKSVQKKIYHAFLYDVVGGEQEVAGILWTDKNNNIKFTFLIKKNARMADPRPGNFSYKTTSIVLEKHTRVDSFYLDIKTQMGSLAVIIENKDKNFNYEKVLKDMTYALSHWKKDGLLKDWKKLKLEFLNIEK